MKITPIELKALGRFRECCEDSAAGGHDVPKEMMQRLATVGVVRTLGFGRHETTEFGDWVLAQPPEVKVSPMAVPHGWKLVPLDPTTSMINALYHDGYTEMLDAAPAAPAAQGDVKDGIIRDLNSIGMKFAAALVALPTLTSKNIDWIDRENVMREVNDWRTEWDKVSARRAAIAAKAAS